MFYSLQGLLAMTFKFKFIHAYSSGIAASKQKEKMDFV